MQSTTTKVHEVTVKRCDNTIMTEIDMKAVNRIVAYLKKTKNYRLELKVGKELNIQIYADAVFAGEKSRSGRRTGYVVVLGEAAIGWRSVDHSCVVLSSLQSQCHSFSTSSITEAMWMRDVLKEVDEGAEEKIHCFQDNAACVVLANSEGLGRAKHIATRFHFVKERLKCGEI